MQFKEFLKTENVYLDGGMGTILQSRGLGAGEYPELWNITHPKEIIAVHKAYFDAGSNVVCTNTFGANTLKFSETELETIIKSALENAKIAREQSISPQEKFIALDIGPLGKLLRPLGDLAFEDAVQIFAKTVQLGVKYGAELVVIETMNDAYETKSALLAVKENCDLPVLVSNAYGADEKLMTGATPQAMVALLEGMGADAIGANCSLGPKQLKGVVEKLLQKASVPVLLKPNAGIPKIVDGETVFPLSVQEFTDEMSAFMQMGVRVVGGCCGTTPAYIQSLINSTKDYAPVPLTDKNITVVSSYTHAVEFGTKPLLIGERINPTGKKRLKQALKDKDISYILSEGVGQRDKGAHILDVNVGLPELDEVQTLQNTVQELQAVINLPLQIDTANIQAMERALRVYNGKALINSVSGKKESMDAVFPLVKKYGGVVVALTLDESGIPQNTGGRVAIAEKILDRAKVYGISKKDIIFDTLAMTVSADTSSAQTTLQALSYIKKELGCHTSLGVSNISFGLPNRDILNATFFALALENGLSCAIMNPYSAEMLKTYYAYNALHNLDENCAEYIQNAPTLITQESAVAVPNTTVAQAITRSPLRESIIKGFKDDAKKYARAMLQEIEPLALINEEIIPALNEIGEAFENKRAFLPQLLMSAEASKVAFEEVKSVLSGKDNAVKKAKFVLATVQGDIHDIGKNIVKLLLENYGFEVLDLGKDVPPERVVETVERERAPLVGLSALMTTTLPAMEETIKLLREKTPWCKIVVGGAVLTEEYAKKIGADKYAKDAMETVRYAEDFQ